MAYPRLRLFAGPNGSGKSTLQAFLRQKGFSVDPVINADDILECLQRTGFLDVASHYDLRNITTAEIQTLMEVEPEIQSRIKALGFVPGWKTENDLFVLEESNAASSEIAALMADVLRFLLVKRKRSFSFETVMSHPSKIDFLERANEEGYTSYLYFISTEDPAINLQRVANRIKTGGHSVPESRVVERYERTMQLLLRALELSQRAFLIDNSGQRFKVIAEKQYGNTLVVLDKRPPNWFFTYVVSKVDQKKQET
jgi:predicted ABC-type ATPase